MSDATQIKWDTHYAKVGDSSAMRAVADNLHLLPQQGLGLEIACGLAANSFAIAQQGIHMEAQDISPVAVERVNQQAKALNLPVTANASDVVSNPPAPAHYDVVVVGRFLDRSLIPALVDALKPGGLMFYQTFTQTRVNEGGPKKDEWRLADNELLRLFAELQVLVYREEACVGDTQRGFRNEALFVGRKRLEVNN